MAVTASADPAMEATEAMVVRTEATVVPATEAMATDTVVRATVSSVATER